MGPLLLLVVGGWLLTRRTARAATPEPASNFSFGWVLPRLGLGNSPKTRADALRLASLGVTHVLDVRRVIDTGGEVPPDTSDAPQKFVGTGIVYHRTPMHDDGRQQSVASYVDAVTFVRNALARPGTRVYVHCAAGRYRSPSVVYAVLRAMGYSADNAWRTVVAGRPQSQRQYIPGADASVASLPHVELAPGPARRTAAARRY